MEKLTLARVSPKIRRMMSKEATQKLQISLYFPDEPHYRAMLQELKHEVDHEATSKGALAREIFLYGFQIYRRLKSLRKLKSERAKLEDVETVSGAESPQPAAPRELVAPQTVRARAERAVQARQRAAARLPGK